MLMPLLCQLVGLCFPQLKKTNKYDVFEKSELCKTYFSSGLAIILHFEWWIQSLESDAYFSIIS